MAGPDDVVVRLRLADVAKFIADVKAGRLAIDDLDKVIRKTNRTAESGSKEYGGLGLWGATVGRLKYAVAGLVLTVGAGAGALAAFAVKSTASLEQVNIGFKQLLGSQGAADKMVASLQDFAKRTPFNFQDVTKMTQKLLAFGDPANQVLGTLTSIGNAVSAFGGSSADMESIVTALGQVAMKGKLAGQEVLQLNEHMINARKYLQDGLGMSGPQLTKAMEAGKISSGTAIPIILAGMQKEFAGMMDVESRSLSGMWSNTFDTIQQQLTTKLTPYLPQMKSFLEWATAKIPGILDATEAFLKGTAAVVGKIVEIGRTDGAQRLFRDIGQTVQFFLPAIGALYEFLTSNTSVGVINSALLGIAAFCEDPVVQVFFGGLGGYALAMWALASATNAYAAAMTRAKASQFIPIGGGMSKGAQFGWGLFPPAAIVVGAGWLAYHFSAGFREKWNEVMRRSGGSNWFTAPFRFVVSAWQQFIVEMFQDTFSRLGGMFSGVGKWVVGWWSDSDRAVEGWATSVGEWFVRTLGPGGLVDQKLVGAWHWLSDGVTGALQGALNWFIDAWNGMVGGIPGFGGSLTIDHVTGMAGAAPAGPAPGGPVGSAGPSLDALPRGANVIPLPRAPEPRAAGDRSWQDTRPVVLVANGKVIAEVVNEGNDDRAARL